MTDARISRQTLSRLVLAATILAGAVLLRTLPVGAWLESLAAWVDAYPLAGAVTYVGLTVVAVVALTPGWIPMMLAGLLFGLLPGVIYGVVGITLGAAVAMVTGRTLARRWVEQRIAGNERMLALDDALEDQAFTIVALTRVAIVIPFNMLNYAYGLTRVGTATYVAATAVGMTPVVALYVYVGTLARDMGAILAGGGAPGPGGWWIAGVAIVTIATIVVVVRRAVQRALDRRKTPVADSGPIP